MTPPTTASPEGSYSTDPYHGEVRIREFKQMVAALHRAGFGVVMDVVYNHMYRQENVLNDTVPYYFFRQNPDGTPVQRQRLRVRVLLRAAHGPPLYDRLHPLLGQGIPHRRVPL